MELVNKADDKKEASGPEGGMEPHAHKFYIDGDYDQDRGISDKDCEQMEMACKKAGIECKCEPDEMRQGGVVIHTMAPRDAVIDALDKEGYNVEEAIIEPADDFADRINSINPKHDEAEQDASEGNEFAQKVRELKAKGAKPGTKFKTSDGEEHTLEQAITKVGLNVEDFFTAEELANENPMTQADLDAERFSDMHDFENFKDAVMSEIEDGKNGKGQYAGKDKKEIIAMLRKEADSIGYADVSDGERHPSEPTWLKAVADELEKSKTADQTEEEDPKTDFTKWLMKNYNKSPRDLKGDEYVKMSKMFQASKKKEDDNEEDDANLGGDDIQDTDASEEQLSFTLTDLSHAIKAKIVEKCGTRDYWENWANDIAEIAEKHIVRISSIVLNSGTSEHKSFMNFVEEIRDDLNPEITENDAVEMLAQHIITRPVFDTLFQGNRFTTENAVSKAMEKVLSQIYSHNIDTETRTLEKFYNSVKRRANDIITSTGRQALIIQLYDRFFRNAFPLMTQKLGIVYTPVEVVDFIIHSIEGVMKEEFKTSLANDGVHILDPFTGTGTFISRLLQSGVIPRERIKDKFKKEIHANEIVLLAYYIACINIEAVYDDIFKENGYQSFNGILLTDTFQLYEQDRDMIANLLPDNSQRRVNQKEQNIEVIIGNPPYSAGQTSANDNAANLKYKNLDNRIENTYSKASTATNKTGLYDSYIRSFRWASDRIEENGVIGFVTNGGWIDGNASDGFRKCLKDEFSKIYVFHLRGNQRTSGELSRKEGGKIFGSGSRAPIAITILVKNKTSKTQGEISFYDIGDYLDRSEKLLKISQLKSISGIKNLGKFKNIIPNSDNDCINQGSPEFKKFIPIKNTGEELSIFNKSSIGLQTSRDAWTINFDKEKLSEKLIKFVELYNLELKSGKTYKEVEKDPKLISWSSSLEGNFKRKEKGKFYPEKIREILYRPFTRSWAYFDRFLIHRLSQMEKIFHN